MRAFFYHFLSSWLNRVALARLTSSYRSQIKKPKYPIILAHGMGGDKPFLRYFTGVAADLSSLGILVAQPEGIPWISLFFSLSGIVTNTAPVSFIPSFIPPSCSSSSESSSSDSLRLRPYSVKYLDMELFTGELKCFDNK